MGSVLSSAARGCGYRIASGIYACCGLGKKGEPLEHFIVDPPIPIDATSMGLSNVGVKLVQLDPSGPHHIVDIIGQEYYPNVTDFLEEVRHMGLSRRLPRSLDFSLLTRESLHILAHARGYIENYDDYYTPLSRDYPTTRQGWDCPRNARDSSFTEHLLDVDGLEDGPPCRVTPQEMCAGLFSHDVRDGTPVNTGPPEARMVRRSMPSFEYIGYERPDNVRPQYKLALVARFPIEYIAVVRDNGSEAERTALEKAQRSGLSVRLEDN